MTKYNNGTRKKFGLLIFGIVRQAKTLRYLLYTAIQNDIQYVSWPFVAAQDLCWSKDALRHTLGSLLDCTVVPKELGVV